jgi:hypothetical protein
MSVDGQPPPRRLTLSIWAALASIAVLIAGLVMLALWSWYDLDDVPGLGPSPFAAAGLFITAVLILAVGASTIAMLNGSRVGLRLACGLAAACALSCAALPLFATGDRPAATNDPNTLVVVLKHNPATTPGWASWSEVAGGPVFIAGAALTAVVLLLPSTRRDLYARRRPTGATTDEDGGPQ